MLRNRYVMSQQTCCGVSGQFSIHETDEDHLHETEHKSALSELNFKPQQHVGHFEQTGVSALCCCSCKPIHELDLQMYGQRLSHATTQTSCCLNLCKAELLVSSLNKVLLGKVLKTCSAYCSQNVLLIQNESGTQILSIKLKTCCQFANIMPRILRCTSQLVYSIVDSQNKEVGTITNLYRNCSTSLCSLRDDFEVHFTSLDKEKEKILVLNAVVLLNQLRHEWL